MPHPLFLTALAISSPQEKATSLPSEVAPDLRGLEAQLRRHEELEHELVGTGRQVSQSGCVSHSGPYQRPRACPCLPLGFPHSRRASAWAYRAWQGMARGGSWGMGRPFSL